MRGSAFDLHLEILRLRFASLRMTGGRASSQAHAAARHPSPCSNRRAETKLRGAVSVSRIMIPVSERKNLHELVDTLPAGEVPAARRYLEFLHGRVGGAPLAPLARVLDSAEMDDEPVSDEDLAAVAEAGEDAAAGRLIPHADVRQRFLRKAP